jgi:hypothetical protein
MAPTRYAPGVGASVIEPKTPSVSSFGPAVKKSVLAGPLLVEP